MTIPVSLTLGILFLLFFLSAAKNDQFENLDTSAQLPFSDDEESEGDDDNDNDYNEEEASDLKARALKDKGLIDNNLKDNDTKETKRETL